MPKEEHVTRNLPVPTNPDELIGATITGVNVDSGIWLEAELEDGREGRIRINDLQYDLEVPEKWEPGMEVRRIVISTPYGQKPFASRCPRCEGGPMDCVEGKTICRECGQSGGDAGPVKKGFSFIIRK